MELGTYLVTGEAHSAGRSTVEVVAAAVAGGVDIVQLREKAMPVRERYDVGRRVRETTAEAGVPLVVNDRIDLALALNADGVHLGDEDLPVTVAREQLGSDAVIGRSVSTPAAAREAERAGADYLGVGAVYGTDSKDTDAEIGLDPIRAIDDTVDIPFVGIGGVTPTNAGDVVTAGADGVAVISAITRADDPEAATRDLAATVAAGRDRR
ncbi:thiamine phosphate synthase [Halorientalis litorea]|uniref:thiamine phosphate synthase n=1 Tax=Halorientalis litorea TaxID=2931977 RepID=UPI001FF19453|nr:thiamine phosphate synthase [Halorientalis litorea]